MSSPLGSFVGGTTTVRLLLNDVSEYRTYLELKKQRFKCKSCQRTFVADTSVAEKHCFISQKVRWSVIARLKENTSMTEIARQKKYFHFFGLSCHEAILPPIESFQTDFAKGLML